MMKMPIKREAPKVPDGARRSSHLAESRAPTFEQPSRPRPKVEALARPLLRFDVANMPIHSANTASLIGSP